MVNQITTPEDIKRLGTIMSVWAHPDDESFSSAGIMATAVQNGQAVVCVTATKGEAGVQDENRWPAAKLSDIREEELHAALQQLGIKNHHWLDYHDGHCQEVSHADAVDKISGLLAKYQPDTVLTFGPDGITGHTDHQSVSKWVSQAVEGTNITVYHTVEEEARYLDYMLEADKKFDIYFNIDKPPIFKADSCDIAYRLPKSIISKKYAALQSMPSQTERMIQSTPKEVMESMLGLECFVLAKSA